MTKTFLPVLQYLFETLKLLKIFFVLNLGFGSFVFVSDFVLRISDLRKVDYTNKFVSSRGYPLECRWHVDPAWQYRDQTLERALQCKAVQRAMPLSRK